MLQNLPQNSPGRMVDVALILVVVNLFGFFIGIYSGLGQDLIVVFFPNIINEELAFLFFASLLQTALFIGLPTLIVVYKYRGSFRELGVTLDNWWSNISFGIVGGIGLFIVVVGAGAIVNYFVPIDPEPQPFARLIMNISEPKQLILPIVMASFLAPLGEEFLFRGFIYPVFRKRTGVVAAIILSSIIFASLHFDLIRFIPLAAGGAGLAWLYERSGSLITPVVAHAVWNTIMTGMIIAAGIT
ncbi:MAG: CPBP family intramembrane metalloprotease [Clostridia bacterium]|nr:CPBP family intramembrane metalloprotease [Clostridia bacterium]